MPATDAFTSSAAAVATSAAALTNLAVGSKVFSRYGGWEVRVTPAGVTVSKASSFGGTQGAIPWPVSLNDAHALAVELLKATT